MVESENHSRELEQQELSIYLSKNTGSPKLKRGPVKNNHYIERIDWVVDYISKHLDDDLSLNTLADIACLSPYHWHRIYTAMRGETAHATVKRLRLQHAAEKLANSDVLIRSIADAAGYSSVESFSRAFKTQYSKPPEKFRARGTHVKYKEAILSNNSQRFSVSIDHLPSTRCASLSHSGPYLQIGLSMGKVFDQLG